jgi:hypothetical protein
MSRLRRAMVSGALTIGLAGAASAQAQKLCGAG